MLQNSFNYYGFDKRTYRDCLNQIRGMNWRHIGYINLWFVLMNTAYSIFAWFNVFGVHRIQIRFYLIYLIVAILFEISLLVLRGFTERHSVLMAYFSVITLLSYSLAESVSQPYMAATKYLVLLVLVALSYIDIMIRAAGVLLLFTVSFFITSFQSKSLSIFYQDLYNGIVFLTLALAMHYVFQRVRMRQFVIYLQSVQMTRDLEVKSSFDALTSLLNRGRFFSMAGEVLRGSHDEYIAICLLDLDSFKQINDKLGHQMGDKVIQIAGNTILNTLKINLSEKWSFPERAIKEKLSFAGRLGGDEFIVLIRGMNDREAVRPLLQDMLNNLNSVELEALHGIHASFGVTEILPEDKDIDRAYTRADEALYISKGAGKNQITFRDLHREGGSDV